MTIHRHLVEPSALGRAAGLAILVGLVLISYARVLFGPRWR